MDTLKDMTIHTLERGQIGVFNGVKYRACRDDGGYGYTSCAGCDFAATTTCSKLAAGSCKGVIFKRVK